MKLASADSLTPAQLDYVRGFYGMTGKRAEICHKYPVKLNRNHYNYKKNGTYFF